MTELPRVIGLYSPAPQSGKTTVATFLERHGYTRISFADTLKDMTVVLLRSLGFSKAEAKHAVHHAKHTAVQGLGFDVRHMLQTLGTEYGRQCLHPDVWVHAWLSRTSEALAGGHRVICDDMRFPNELDAVRSLSGAAWQVTRSGVVRMTTHASEGSLDAYEHFDFVLRNDGSLSQLHLAVCQRLGITPHFALPEAA